MRKQTALSWANCMEISEKEFNEHLVELGYQNKNNQKKKWIVTMKGIPHSVKMFGKIYWDVDVMFAVLNANGLKTRTYFYCSKCSAYNKITSENEGDIFCRKCGYMVTERT